MILCRSVLRAFGPTRGSQRALFSSPAAGEERQVESVPEKGGRGVRRRRSKKVGAFRFRQFERMRAQRLLPGSEKGTPYYPPAPQPVEAADPDLAQAQIPELFQMSDGMREALAGVSRERPEDHVSSRRSSPSAPAPPSPTPQPELLEAIRYNLGVPVEVDWRGLYYANCLKKIQSTSRRVWVSWLDPNWADFIVQDPNHPARVLGLLRTVGVPHSVTVMFQLLRLSSGLTKNDARRRTVRLEPRALRTLVDYCAGQAAATGDLPGLALERAALEGATQLLRRIDRLHSSPSLSFSLAHALASLGAVDELRTLANWCRESADDGEGKFYKTAGNSARAVESWLALVVDRDEATRLLQAGLEDGDALFLYATTLSRGDVPTPTSVSFDDAPMMMRWIAAVTLVSLLTGKAPPQDILEKVRPLLPVSDRREWPPSLVEAVMWAAADSPEPRDAVTNKRVLRWAVQFFKETQSCCLPAPLPPQGRSPPS
eukprot:Hpha_TRINITY_DN31960_c0_g1::TRINITY_DN31960_c0_g1_i1::g.21933::m.21933